MAQWIVAVQGGTPSELEAKALDHEDGATSENVRLAGQERKVYVSWRHGGDGMRGREMNMCFPWVPYRIGRKGSTGGREMDELRARQKGGDDAKQHPARESERTGHQGTGRQGTVQVSFFAHDRS